MQTSSGVRVSAAIIVRGKRLLAARRPAGGPRGGLWELPGGKVEPGESTAQGLARELLEELGIRVEVDPCDQVVDHRYPDLHVTLYAHPCRLKEGEPRPLVHDAVRWVDAREIAELQWSAADRPIVARLARLLGGSESPKAR